MFLYTLFSFFNKTGRYIYKKTKYKKEDLMILTQNRQSIAKDRVLFLNSILNVFLLLSFAHFYVISDPVDLCNKQEFGSMLLLLKCLCKIDIYLFKLRVTGNARL
jgi:hypothetical protein